MQYMLLDVTKSEVPTKNFKIAVISNCSSKVEQKKCSVFFIFQCIWQSNT